MGPNLGSVHAEAEDGKRSGALMTAFLQVKGDGVERGRQKTRAIKTAREDRPGWARTDRRIAGMETATRGFRRRACDLLGRLSLVNGRFLLVNEF